MPAKFEPSRDYSPGEHEIQIAVDSFIFARRL